MQPSPSASRVVQVRTATNVSALVGAGVAVAVVAAIVVAGALADGGFDRSALIGLAGALGMVLAVGALILLLARGRDLARWDLDRRTITWRRGQVGFDQIHRVIVCTGTKGYYGILFFGEQGQLAPLSIPVGYRDHPPLAVWHAIRELFASPFPPSLEGYGTPMFSAREFATKPPVSATRGPRALAIIDAQIAWIAHGGNARSNDAPLEQFRLSRHQGP